MCDMRCLVQKFSQICKIKQFYQLKTPENEVFTKGARIVENFSSSWKHEYLDLKKNRMMLETVADNLKFIHSMEIDFFASAELKLPTQEEND